MRWSTSGRRRRVVALGVVLAVAAVGTSVGLAKSGPSQVTVPVQLFNANCGFPTSKKFIGKAKFIASKGILTVRMKLHGAVPGTYELEIWTGDTCEKIAGVDKFKVDASGDGEASGSIAVSGQRFFATAHDQDTGEYHDSLIAKVGSL
jgi:hypothetical protein